MDLTDMSNVSGLEMPELQVILIFGIGALFLYIIVPTAILANEVRLAKQSDDTSGASAVLSAVAQAGFFIVAWLLFVTIIMFLVVGAGGHGAVETNPANGMWNFWYYNWMGADMTNLSPTISTEAQKAQARMIILTLSGAKLLEILVLGVLLLLTINLSMALPLYKLRRVQHYQMSSEIDISSAMMYLMMFVTGMIMFQFIIQVDNYMLQAIFEFAKDTANVSGIDDDTSGFNILNDLWKLIAEGQKNMPKVI